MITTDSTAQDISCNRRRFLSQGEVLFVRSLKCVSLCLLKINIKVWMQETFAPYLSIFDNKLG